MRERLAPLPRLVDAALALAAVDSDDDVAFARGVDRLRKSAERWARAKGWEPANTDETGPDQGTESVPPTGRGMQAVSR